MSTADEGKTNVDPEEARRAAINEIATMVTQEYEQKGEGVPSRRIIWLEASRRYSLLEKSKPATG